MFSGDVQAQATTIRYDDMGRDEIKREKNTLKTFYMRSGDDINCL